MRSILASTLALLATSNFATSVWPPTTALPKGVTPLLSSALTSALPASSRSITFLWPLRAARCKDVWPVLAQRRVALEAGGGPGGRIVPGPKTPEDFLHHPKVINHRDNTLRAWGSGRGGRARSEER